MKNDRALTWVGTGVAKLANRWMERRWSSFMGHSTEFQFPPDQEEWFSGPCPEFEVQLKEQALSMMDFGIAAFEERCDPNAATLAIRYTGQDLEIESHCILFHGKPGMIRRWWIINRSETLCFVQHAEVELLQWAGVPKETQGLLALSGRGGGILIGGSENAMPFTRPAPPNTTGLRIRIEAELLPGARHLLGNSFLYPHSDSMDRALSRGWPRFLEDAAQYHEALERAERLQRAPAEEPPES